MYPVDLILAVLLKNSIQLVVTCPGSTTIMFIIMGIDMGINMSCRFRFSGAVSDVPSPYGAWWGLGLYNKSIRKALGGCRKYCAECQGNDRL